jgi:hypothetical protein
MQETVNRLGDAYAKVACMNAVTRLIMDTGAVSPAERNKLTNEIGQIIEKAPGRAFEFTSPPLLSVDVVNFVATVKGWIRERLGAQQSPMQKDVPSIVTGPAIEGLQLSLETPVRTASRRVEELYARIGQKFISRVFQYYTSNRLIHVIGPDARWQQFEFQRMSILTDDKNRPRSQEDIRKAWRDYNFCVSPGSSLAVTKTTRAMMYQQFAQLGWMHPRKVMEAVGIQNPNEEIKAAMEAREMGLIAGAETSNVPATLSKMKGALAA